MITIKTISDFSHDSDEGKMLLAALAVLTSIDKKDITENKWGGWVHPDDALRRVADLANKIYYEEEWKAEESRIKRDEKISKIIEE